MNTKVIFKYGAMNSGKSLDLIRVAHNYNELGLPYLVLKSSLDTRMPGLVYSRTKLSLPANEINSIKINDIVRLITENKNAKCILVDESNFLSAEAIDTIIDLAYLHQIDSVIFYGLKNDFTGQLFEGSKRILERADEIEESTSLCFCGRKARQNARIVDGALVRDGKSIVVDDGNSDVVYIPLCNHHYHRGDFELR